jgi:hypothetical protein
MVREKEEVWLAISEAVCCFQFLDCLNIYTRDFSGSGGVSGGCVCVCVCVCVCIKDRERERGD